MSRTASGSRNRNPLLVTPPGLARKSTLPPDAARSQAFGLLKNHPVRPAGASLGLCRWFCGHLYPDLGRPRRVEAQRSRARKGRCQHSRGSEHGHAQPNTSRADRRTWRRKRLTRSMSVMG